MNSRLMTRRRTSNGVRIHNLTPKLVQIASLKSLGQKTREHSSKQISKIADCIHRLGFAVPVVIDSEGFIIDGEAVIAAVRQLGLAEIPAVCISDLSESQLRALRLALNKIPEYASWNEAALKLELAEIIQLEPTLLFDDMGFETAEIDGILDDGGLDEEDELPTINEQAVPITQPGDQFIAGDHITRCDDALRSDSFAHLLGSEQAGMAFTDPPYNVPIDGRVTRSKSAKRHDFPMAMGEMSSHQFRSFLETALGHMAHFSRDGAIHYVCIDWRHLQELLAAGEAVYTELKNLCVWNKSNAGMGSLYRSQHEFIFVYKNGTAPHINNIELGRYGRMRANVWNYVSQSALSGTSKSKLSLHPTVKPVAMIADAIRDCSNRGDLILDPFGGAGTTLIAAEKTGRRARLIELNPVYVDVTIERWERLTGRTAYHAETGGPFSRAAVSSNSAKSPGSLERR
jgi:DNA modification methylase